MKENLTNGFGKIAKMHLKRFLMHLKMRIFFRMFITTLVVNLRNVGKKNILIYQASLIFILLNWISNSYAIDFQIKEDLSLFNKIKEKIHNQKNCGVEYNSSKTAAIVGGACGSPDYINFKTKQTYTITKEQYRSFYVKWLDDHVAILEAGCGTGCLEAYIFVAPATVISCSNHDYRISFLDPHQPPDYSHNRPLLVDPKKGVYVCYDGDDNIQVFPLPKQPTIRPPKGFFSERAEIRNGKLTVIYKNTHGEIKQVDYRLSKAKL